MSIFKMAVFLLCFAIAVVGCSKPHVNRYQDSLSPWERLRIGMEYDLKEEYPAAIREYKLASEEVPEAHYLLGNIYFSQKDFTLAEIHYKAAIEAMPEDAKAYNNLAWMYLTQEKNLDKAEALAEEGLRLAPKEQLVSYQETLDRIRKANMKP